MAQTPHNCKHECNEWVVSWPIDGTRKSLRTIFKTSSRHLQDIFNHPPPTHTPIQTQMDTLAYTRHSPQYVPATCLHMWLQVVFICGCKLCWRHIHRDCCYPKSPTQTITNIHTRLQTYTPSLPQAGLSLSICTIFTDATNTQTPTPYKLHMYTRTHR